MTETRLKPRVETSGGSRMWLADNADDPEIRSVRPGRAVGGSEGIGLRRNEEYTVAGINQLPLLPGILVALTFLMAIGSAWCGEGRRAAFGSLAIPNFCFKHPKVSYEHQRVFRTVPSCPTRR